MRLFAIRALLAACIALTCAAVITPTQAQAQDSVDVINYEAWGALAVRAENAIEAALASNEALESLRAEVVIWRERFLSGQSANAARIETLRSQVSALGPLPEEGESETDELAQRRTDLAMQLRAALAPVRTAEEAFSRADGLVGEIDAIIRERQTDALLKLGPTPLNPAEWPTAIADIWGSVKAMGTHVQEAWSSEITRTAFQDRLPKILLYLAIAVLLVFRGRVEMERITGLVLDRTRGRGRRLAGFVTSLGQIIVPVLGIYLLVEALQATGFLGLRALVVTEQLPIFGFSVFGARWLGLRLFPKRSDVALPFDASPEQGRTLRVSATLLGLMVGLLGIVWTLAEYEGYSEASTASLIFPLAVLIALILLRVGRIFGLLAVALDEGEAATFSRRGLRIVGQLVLLLAVVSIALLAVGYRNAGLFLLTPTVYTLGLLGLLLILNELIRDIYALTVGCDLEEARAALIPTLLAFVMVLAAIPIFALIWGARIADLTEIWAQFREGFSLGETRISPENFLTFAIVFVVLYLATRLLQNALRTSVLPKTSIDVGGQTAIVSGLGYVGIILAAVIAITTAGIDLSSLAFVAGALSIGIGFGLQNIVQNFVAGIILLIERPVAEGDWIEVGGYMGTVKKISVRSTLIETFDRTDVIVPNGDFISGAVTNWTRSNLIGRVKVPVGVAYGTDTRKVERLLKEIALEHPLVTLAPEPGVDFMGFGADSLDFQIRAVIRDVNFGITVKTELNHRISEVFEAEGIEIPFAQRDVWLRNPEALTGKSAQEQPAQPREEGPPSVIDPAHLDDEDFEVGSAEDALEGGNRGDHS